MKLRVCACCAYATDLMETQLPLLTQQSTGKDATLTAMATFDAVNIDTLTDANFANFTGIDA